MRHVTAFVLAFLLAMATAGAAQVTMKNGDRLSGKLMHKRGEALTLATPYAGEVKIRWADIAEIESDGPVEIVRRDGTLQTVVLQVGDRARLADVEYINPDAAQAGRGTVYEGRVTVAVNLATGNSRSRHAYGEFALRARARQHRYRLSGNATRASEQDGLTASNWLLGGQYDHFLAPRRFLYGRASVENDEFRDIRLRSTVGTGLGYQIVDTPDTQLSIVGGPEYVFEDHYEGEGLSYPAAGWGVQYSQWLWSRRAQVFLEQEGFWSLENVDDVVVRTKTGLRLPVTADWKATAQVNVDYDSDPAPGRTSTDTTWLLGLGYAF